MAATLHLCSPSGSPLPTASTGCRPQNPLRCCSARPLHRKPVHRRCSLARLRASAWRQRQRAGQRWRRWGESRGQRSPGRVGGEACRIGLVRLSGTATWRQATVAAVWDRLSEVPPVLVLSLMALIGIRHFASGWRAASIVVGVTVALILGGLAIGKLGRLGIGLTGWRERPSRPIACPAVCLRWGSAIPVCCGSRTSSGWHVRRGRSVSSCRRPRLRPFRCWRCSEDSCLRSRASDR